MLCYAGQCDKQPITVSKVFCLEIKFGRWNSKRGLCVDKLTTQIFLSFPALSFKRKVNTIQNSVAVHNVLTDSRHQIGRWLCKEALSLTRSLQTPCHPAPSWGSHPLSETSDPGRPPVEIHITLIWCCCCSGNSAHTHGWPLFEHSCSHSLF